MLGYDAGKYKLDPRGYARYNMETETVYDPKGELGAIRHEFRHRGTQKLLEADRTKMDPGSRERLEQLAFNYLSMPTAYDEALMEFGDPEGAEHVQFLDKLVNPAEARSDYDLLQALAKEAYYAQAGMKPPEKRESMEERALRALETFDKPLESGGLLELIATGGPLAAALKKGLGALLSKGSRE